MLEALYPDADLEFYCLVSLLATIVLPMKRPSFSTQLVVLWALVAALCAMLVGIVWFMAISAEGQQMAGAAQQAAAACEAVASRYSLSRPLTRAASNTDLMQAVLDTVEPASENSRIR